MRGIGNIAFRAISNGFSRPCHTPRFVKPFSTFPPSGNWNDDKGTPNSFESNDEFEKRIFGGISGNGSASDSFYQKLDRIEKARNRAGSRLDEGSSSNILDGLDESFNTLWDGVDDKLDKAARYFEYDSEEVEQEDYKFRPDMNFPLYTTYETKDLDLRKPGVSKPPKRYEFEVTTEEVLRKADFRNVKFLANFITEAGIIIKRSKTGISAKAQRKVAREIKTARAFGLMPFTTMGTKSFIAGKTMEDLAKDFEYETRVDEVNEEEPLQS